MTCREFKQITEPLTLWELLRRQDRELLSHAEACGSCGSWLQQQRVLAANMQALQARTAAKEAGSKVEQALLQAFRQRNFESRTVSVNDRITPVAWRLSRFFEVGAYAAVAAALLVVLFLGVRLWQQRTDSRTAQGPNTRISQPLGASEKPAQLTSHNSETQKVPVERAASTASPARGRRTPAVSAGDESGQDAADAGYVPLMFCDPLSCSAETQVVRMELPLPVGQDSQPQLADVVVGYDGVVRAVRIVD